MAAPAQTSGDIVRLKITLKGSKPPIWRRLLIPAAMRLDQLHCILQVAMGWEGGHLHAFDIGGRSFGDPHEADDVSNEARMTPGGVWRSGVRRFTYTYDFGDDWEHAIDIEGVEKPATGQQYPACTSGKRNCPPEDCGGIYGYMESLSVIADPAHPNYENTIELFGEDFDPEAFSVDELNARLISAFGGKPVL